jgi:hypothetical protein
LLNPLVTVVAFKKFCASIPLRGDLQTKINFPTGFPNNSLADDVFDLIFRALYPPRNQEFWRSCGEVHRVLERNKPIGNLIIQLKKEL